MAKILVADDDVAQTVLLREFAQSLGHEVKVETDGLQAGIRAKEWLPSVVLLDIQMPNFYGTTAAVSLSQSPETARIPIIFISGVPAPEAEKLLKVIRSRVRYPDRVHLLSKPVDLAALGKLIGEMLAKAAAG